MHVKRVATAMAACVGLALLANTVLTPAASTRAKGMILTAGCAFTAPVPTKSDSNVTASVSVSGCGDVNWRLILQRHRYGPIWQNLATNQQQGDDSFTISAGCNGSGDRTYRIILESNRGHKVVSGHNRFSC